MIRAYMCVRDRPQIPGLLFCLIIYTNSALFAIRKPGGHDHSHIPVNK